MDPAKLLFLKSSWDFLNLANVFKYQNENEARR